MSAEITNGITKKKPPFEVGKAALIDKIFSLSLSLVPPRRVFWFLQSTPFLLPPFLPPSPSPPRICAGPVVSLSIDKIVVLSLSLVPPSLSRFFGSSKAPFFFYLPPFLPPPPPPHISIQMHSVA